MPVGHLRIDDAGDLTAVLGRETTHEAPHSTVADQQDAHNNQPQSPQSRPTKITKQAHNGYKAQEALLAS